MGNALLLNTLVIGVALLGLALCVLGLRRLWGRHPVIGSLQGLSGVLLLALAVLAGAIALNLYTYQRLTEETPLAEVRLQAVGPQQFQVYVVTPDRQAAVYELRGDEWQLDARILKWQAPAALLGLHTLYRLERLSGRYRDIARERSGPHSVYALGASPGLDLWQLARAYQRWLPWVDAVYGSAAYVPMADGARYAVTLGSSGLVVRPLNPAAEAALRTWP